MSGNAVGFAFQADVTNTGSLLHTLTGRALKAMSDGGVDFYSVVAAIAIGKDVVLRDSLENTVRPHIMSKGGFQSVLSKALSIGWGHKGLAVEMANTKAGTNALLLMGALTTGSTHFQAAQCFSELLSLRGCEPDKLPNVDVLKHMIGYFAPFVHDLGFSKVLENVTTTATRQIKIETKEWTDAYNRLTIHGDAAGVAGGINQLLFTSHKGETHYMVTRIRGAWFAVFAAHILGMSVELRLNDIVIWASAGNNGAAIFELGEHQIEKLSVQAISNHRIELIDSSDAKCRDPIVVDYLVGEVFESLVAREPEINPAVWEDVRKNICRIVFSTSSKFAASGRSPEFEQEGALRETLEAFGFDATHIEDGRRNHYDPPRHPVDDNWIQDMFISVYGRHHVVDGPGLPPHPYQHVGKFIRGLVVSVLNLTRCRFDPKSLRIREDFFDNDIIYRDMDVGVNNRHPRSDFENKIMINIMSLIGDDDTNRSRKQADSSYSDQYTIGLSSGGYTVGFTSILQTDCYDIQGRFISIWSGRASANGVLRPIIRENKGSSSMPGASTQIHPTSSVAPGFFVEPHYYPSNTKVFMRVSIDQDTILLQFMAGSEGPYGSPLSISRGVCGFAKYAHIVRCPHDPNTKYRVDKDTELVLLGFNPSYPDMTFSKRPTIDIFALHGNKIEQVLMAGLVRNEGRFIFQLLACLECCVEAARARHLYSAKKIIMGG